LSSKLKICFVHGGGSFAFLLGRLENAWQHHPVAHGVCELPPGRYVERFYVDSAVFDVRALEFLVGTMGSDRVMLGSDYPFPLGEHRIGQFIKESHLPPVDKVKLLDSNARRFLGLGEAVKAREHEQSGTNAASSPAAPDGQQLTYSSYLKVPQLLELQRPQSSPRHHDELLFIIVHQTYELWFKELLHDLDAVVANLKAAGANPKSRDEVYEAARLLRRCTEITRVLVEQFTILETMLPTHFLAFRDKLEPASGFQSEQFRELEFLCGLKDEKMLRYHKPTPEAQEAIAKLSLPEGQPTERDWFEARARAIQSLYKDESHHRDWIDVCERLTEFDELVVSWRLRHIQLVERTIGVRMGTGGSTGASYLKLTLDKKFFPELWEARTLLTQ